MKKIISFFSTLTLIISSIFTIAVTPVSASGIVIYNNIPTPLPGNLPSEAFEAQSASEFGGQIAFAGTARQNPTVTVTMS
ncbi:MAG: hypothetical protein KGL95_04780, partial [Patescibacteria group bacterium]|nr:hypothetical protein [Patescibacteria group bacterium]